MDRPPPTDAQLAQLHDRLWHDLRRRDDRTEFAECDSCGRAVRWVANLGSATGGNIQLVARPLVTSAALYEPTRHAGLVAVFTDRTGFTVSRFTTREEVDGAFLYECHWDICEHARQERDRISAQRRHPARDAEQDFEALDAVDRYAAWRRGRDR